MRPLISALIILLTATSASAQQAVQTETTETTDSAQALELTVLGQVFAGWDSTRTGGESFHELVLRRAELGAALAHAPTDSGLLINVEALRSAGPQSLFGVDGDAIILRAKHAFGVWRPRLGPGQLELRAGLIPDVWINAVERGYDLRGAAPLLSERAHLFDSSDLGASVGYMALDGLVSGRVALTNGEGRSQRELNNGKNITAAASIRPLAATVFGEPGELALHVAWRDGSTGVASAASHRLAAAVTLAHPRLFAGAEYVRATGWQGRGELEADALGAWANVSPWLPWLGAYGRYDRMSLVDRADTGVTLMQAGLYADLVRAESIERPIFGFPQVRLYLGWSGERHEAQAGPLPGAASANDADIFMLTLSARGAATR